MKHYDLIVIGSGSGGFSAATAARKGGVKNILLVEKREVGYSLCTNEGCMPSKTLLSSKKLGLSWGDAQERTKKLVKDEFFGFRKEMVESSGFDIAKGVGKFVSSKEILVDGEKFSADYFVVATGSDVFVPPIKGLDEVGYITSKEVLTLDELPKSLIIIGGGFIAVEMATLFHSMGSKVSIYERGDRLLKRLDKDLSEELGKAFKEKGIELNFGADVNDIRDIRKGDETVLMAVGRRPAVGELGLDKIGVEIGERGEVVVDEFLKTSIRNIYAVGDSNGKAPLVYAASMEGRIAGMNVSGSSEKVDYSLVGTIVFSNPEIGSVGLSEEEAPGSVVSTIKMADIGKALAMGETTGFVKMVADSKGKILGLHIIGVAATDLVQVVIPHLYHGDSVFDVLKIPYPHPTLGEALSYPAEEIAGKVGK